jgi:hypothetical protein
LNAAYFPLERRRRLQLNGDETPRERAGKLIAQHINEYESNKAEVRKMVSSYASTEEKNRRLQFPEEQLFPVETYTFFVLPLKVAFTDCLFEVRHGFFLRKHDISSPLQLIRSISSIAFPE